MKQTLIFALSVVAFHSAAAQTGTANPRSRSLTAADKAYVISVREKIRSNVAYADPSDGNDNPKVTYRVLLLPTGEIMSVDRLHSSGVPDFDAAVQRGIWRASPLPKRSDGEVEHALVIEYSLKN